MFVCETMDLSMIDTPEIIQRAEQRTAVIHIVVAREQIRSVMGPGRQELIAVLAEQKITPIGPFFSHHLRLDPMVFDFEIGVPVEQAVTSSGRVKPSRLPPCTLARTIYHGPYEGLHQAWVAFDQWIVAQEKIPGPSLVECYLSGPESGPDSSHWRTELSRAIFG